MINTQCYTWDNADILWDDNPYTWDEVCLVLTISAGRRAGIDDDPHLAAVKKLNQKDKKKFIKLFFKVKLQTEPDMWFVLREMEALEAEEVDNVKITVADVKMVIESVKKYINIEV